MRDRRSQKENESKKIWKVALYMRLSREDGREESYSIQNQRQILTKYLEKFDDEYIVVDTYSDDGFSGTNSDRHDFQRLLEDIRIGRVNCVIVKDLSRLSRNYSEAGYYLEHYFVSHGIRFISLELPTLDSYKYPEQMDSIIVPIQNVINDDFCRQTSIKVRGVFNVKRSNGEFIGSFAPYGYIKDPKDGHRLIVDEEAAQVVKDIYSWYVNDGMSKRGIAMKLNSLGISTASQYKHEKGMKYKNPNRKFDDSFWCSATITKILTNQVYIGDMVQGRQKVKSYKVRERLRVPKEEWYIVENTHEAIIDKETFDKTQELMLRDMRTAPTKWELYLLSGYVRCAECGMAMHRQRSGKNIYYSCRKNHYTKKCGKKSIREDILTEAVYVSIKKQIELVTDITKTLEKISKSSQINTQTAMLNSMQKKKQVELQEAVKVSDCLYIDWKNGEITQEEYRRMKGDFTEKIEQIKSAVKEIISEREKISKDINTSKNYYEQFIKHKNIPNLTREILVELVDEILVHDNKEITIKFKNNDQYQNILEFIESNKKSLKQPV
ncbi:MAG: recombinase family protein [Firmicutes bacterium]|nr:recombinase family protein [Bacillota bacterium]